MHRWLGHVVAICGGVAAVYAAGVVQRLGAEEWSRTLRTAWAHVYLSRALWAVAGFFLLVPFILPLGNRQRSSWMQWAP